MHVNAWGNRAWELGQDALPMRVSISRVGPGTGNNPKGGMMLVHVDDYSSLVNMVDHDAVLRRFIARRSVVLIVPITQLVQIHSLPYGAEIIASVLKENEVVEGGDLFQQAICPIQLSSKWANLYDQYGPIVTPERDQRISLRSFARMPLNLIWHAEACQSCGARTRLQVLQVEKLIKQGRFRRKAPRRSVTVEDFIGAIFKSGSVTVEPNGDLASGIVDRFISNLEHISGETLTGPERELARTLFEQHHGLDNDSVPVGI